MSAGIADMGIGLVGQMAEPEERIYRSREVETADRSFPKWGHFKALRTSRIVTSMHFWLLIVPVAAKALSGLGPELPIPALGPDVSLSTKLPFSWSIFYFSAILFSVGNLVYVLRCPRIVQDHENAGEFQRQGKGFDQVVHYALDAGFTEERFQEHIETAREVIKEPAKRYDRLFWIARDRANGARSPSLWACAVLYGGGVLLMSVVLLQNFGEVLQILVRSAGQ